MTKKMKLEGHGLLQAGLTYGLQYSFCMFSKRGLLTLCITTSVHRVWHANSMSEVVYYS